MEDTSVESQPLDSGDSAYPKPPGWESLSHGQRYAALTQEPRPESTAARNALLHAKQSELRAMNLKRKAAIAEHEAPLLFESFLRSFCFTKANHSPQCSCPPLLHNT